MPISFTVNISNGSPATLTEPGINPRAFYSGAADKKPAHLHGMVNGVDPGTPNLCPPVPSCTDHPDGY